jgi:hypothetical protein
MRADMYGMINTRIIKRSLRDHINDRDAMGTGALLRGLVQHTACKAIAISKRRVRDKIWHRDEALERTRVVVEGSPSKEFYNG